MLKAVAAVIVLSVFCGYLTLCLLYYHGQSQLVLDPGKTIAATPATLGLAFDQIEFDDTETGQPQLTGWWIPAAPTALAPNPSPRSHLTLLYCHDGHGSLSDALPQLAALHALGVNLFAIDYRGFGRSAPIHPTQQTMFADADTAWAYLTATRNLPPQTIVLYGDRLGAAVAAQAALHHPAAAVVLLSPFESLLTRVLADPRSDLVPVRLLFHNRFDLAAYIAQVRQPKLFAFDAASNGGASCVPKDSNFCPTPDEAQRLYQQAAYPKELFNGSGQPMRSTDYTAFLARFLDEYAPASPKKSD